MNEQVITYQYEQERQQFVSMYHKMLSDRLDRYNNDVNKNQSNHIPITSVTEQYKKDNADIVKTMDITLNILFNDYTRRKEALSDVKTKEGE